MTDHELLELAAKAVGAEVTGMRGNVPVYGMPVEDEDGCTYTRWDPLNDDGDALRLAVRLGMCVDVRQAHTEVTLPGDYYPESEEHEDDPEAATRRAIVRAAAEIGREMT